MGVYHREREKVAEEGNRSSALNAKRRPSRPLLLSFFCPPHAAATKQTYTFTNTHAHNFPPFHLIITIDNFLTRGGRDSLLSCRLFPIDLAMLPSLGQKRMVHVLTRLHRPPSIYHHKVSFQFRFDLHTRYMTVSDKTKPTHRLFFFPCLLLLFFLLLSFSIYSKLSFIHALHPSVCLQLSH